MAVWQERAELLFKTEGLEKLSKSNVFVVADALSCFKMSNWSVFLHELFLYGKSLQLFAFK
ncbi:MAG: hypothetical protein ACK447_14125, partial [Flavobacterium sp.]